MTPEQLVQRYQQRYGRIRANTEREIGLIWDRLGGLTDSHAERAAIALAEQANVATMATVQLVEALVVATGRLAGEDLDPDLDPDELTGPALRGVDPMEEWTRPVVTARVAISQGSDFDAAMALGRHRAQTLSLTDALLAQRAAMTRSGVVGYRRVLTGKSCVLCQVASTQRYHSDSLMPIHDHCDCSVAPIIGSADPGRVVNQDLLDELKFSGDYQRLADQRTRMGKRSTVGTAERRAEQARRELRTETDPARRRRLEDRARRWEDRANEADLELRQRITEAGERSVADFQRLLDDIDARVARHGELGPIIEPAA